MQNSELASLTLELEGLRERVDSGEAMNEQPPVSDAGSGSGVDWPSAPAENIELAETYYRAFEVLARDADFVADVWARKPLLVKKQSPSSIMEL